MGRSDPRRRARRRGDVLAHDANRHIVPLADAPVPGACWRRDVLITAVLRNWFRAGLVRKPGATVMPTSA